jgi:hypothetical protein
MGYQADGSLNRMRNEAFTLRERHFRTHKTTAGSRGLLQKLRP